MHDGIGRGIRRSLLASFAVVALTTRIAAATPFIVTASSGPAAGSHIDATVTRRVDGKSVTLPAALVPALDPGDIVDVDFPDYRRPPSTVNYHVNAAFITETARQHWLFERSGSEDRLFSNASRKASAAGNAGHLHFIYGTGNRRGIPIFFIVPEDAKTRGMDGVRDYVGAHPTDFVDMSQTTNTAVDQYSFLRDFLTTLGSGSIDPVSSRQRIETLAEGVGVSPETIDECYLVGGTAADIQNCVQQAVNSVVYATNFSAPTQGQFLGGVVGAASPTVYAPYIASLLTVWRLFVHTGHIEYEYLPTSITLADPSTVRTDELLVGVKVPTIRPPAAASDVLFFTIGDPLASEHAPIIVSEAPANGVCERTDRFSVPLHFDHTSRYVHSAALIVRPDGKEPYTIPLDPRSLDAPTIDRARLHPSVDGAYSISLTARFGFQTVGQTAASARVVVPGSAPWKLAMLPHHVPVAGTTLDAIASSPAAPCVSRAEMQVGSAAPIPITMSPLDAGRTELRASLNGVPAGPAIVRLYQDDSATGRELETTLPVQIAPAPATVDPASAIASLGDSFVALSGRAFEHVRSVLIDGVPYVKMPGATATSACFSGAPFAASRFAIGQSTTAQLVPDDGSAGQVFPLSITAPRPQLDPVVSAAPATPYFSTSAVTVNLHGPALPRQLAVRVRHADATPQTPCDAVRADPTSAALPAADVQVRTGSDAVITFRPDVLAGLAFGALQVQITDDASKLSSLWQTIPGTVVRAPDVSQIACPADAAAPCRLYGAGLPTIGGVQTAGGAFVAAGPDCAPTPKGVACVLVPHMAHYVLRLLDGNTQDPLPDSLITKG